LGFLHENENSSKIFIRAESKEEADHSYNELAAGAKIEVPISDGPWGSYWGMFRDKYGMEWVVEILKKKRLGAARNIEPESCHHGAACTPSRSKMMTGP